MEFMVREMMISRSSEEARPFYARFHVPEARGNLGVVCRIVLECDYFTREVEFAGEDGPQALFCAAEIAAAYLSKFSRSGYRIWWLGEDDALFENFWTYRKSR